MTLVVCVVCASSRGVGVDRRRACPHRRDVGALVHSKVPMVSRPSWAQWLCEVVCGNRGRRAHTGYSEDRGGLGNEGTIRLYMVVHLCRGGDGPLRPMVVQHGDTPH